MSIRRFRTAFAALATLTILAACADQPTAPVAEPPAGPSLLLVTTPASYVQMDVGFVHTCAVDLAGAVTCWGGDGDGRTTVPPSAQSGITRVSAGDAHTCALSTAGAVTCWGRNASGQSTVPQDAGVGIVQVSAGGAHTCAVDSAAAVICWGDNTYGQSSVPTSAGSSFVQVSAGGVHTCAVTIAGAVICWGFNENGKWTVPDAAGSDIVQVTAGGVHTCALNRFTVITCWGDDSQRQTSVPTAALDRVAQIDAGFLHTCAVTTAGAVNCWGFNVPFGQATVPQTAQSGIAEVSGGGYHTCARSTAGAVICWGDNQFGQMNVPTTTSRVLPTATFEAPTTPVAAGQSFTLTLTGAQVPGSPMATTFTYAFDCGDGVYTEPSTTATASCPTSVAGTLSVRGKVIDAGGDVAEYAASVAVNEAALNAAEATIALRDRVQESALSAGLRRALTAKLDDALKALSAGKTKSACSALADFAGQVQAQRGKAIPESTADAWLAETALIRTAAGC